MQMPLMDPCEQVPEEASGTDDVVLSTFSLVSTSPFWYMTLCMTNRVTTPHSQTCGKAAYQEH